MSRIVDMGSEVQSGAGKHSQPQTRLPAAERRSQLLEVSMRLFAAKGFHETSMDEVAEAAGVTKPIVYQHFDSKRALYAELLGQVGVELLEAVTSATASADGPRGQVEAGFEAYFSFVAGKSEAFHLLFGSGARMDEELAKVLKRVERGMAVAIASLIDAGVDEDHRMMLAYGITGIAEATGRRYLSMQRAYGRVHSAGPKDESSTEGKASLGQVRDTSHGFGKSEDGPSLGPEVLAHRVAQMVWAGLRSVSPD